MDVIWQYPDALLALFGSAVALGTTGLLEKATYKVSLSFGLAILLLLAAGATALAGLPTIVVAAVAAPAAFVVLLSALRLVHARLLRCLGTLLGSRYLHASIVLAAGPLVACFLVFRGEAQPDGPDFFIDDAVEQVLRGSLQPAPERAVSDSGVPVPLFGISADVSALNLKQSDGRLNPELAARVLRLASAEPTHNCHGWVFGGGRYWVRGDDVQQILEENSYHPVSKPQAGDVIIYRDPGGEIVHSGVVRLVENDLILIESKWGTLGRFLHAPADQGYAPRWTYYHSGRDGHLLRIESTIPDRPRTALNAS